MNDSRVIIDQLLDASFGKDDKSIEVDNVICLSSQTKIFTLSFLVFQTITGKHHENI